MNIFHKVTGKTLWKNKTRTTVTIIGIILSAAMITAVTTLVSSFQVYLRDMAVYQEGNWYTNLLDVSRQDYEDLQEDPGIEQIQAAQILGYAESESSNPDKPYLYVLGIRPEFAQNMPVHLIGGRLPENTSEIVLPAHLGSNGEVQANIGDQMSLSLGSRMTDGYSLGQMNPFLGEEEKLENTKVHTYTVVGFYERPNFEEYSAPGYTALTGWDESAGQITYELYMISADPKQAYLIPKDYPHYGVRFNDDVLMFSGASNHNSFYTVLYGMAAIIIVLILFGSVALIYNAFSISISDRTRQFGLLASVGATKKQLRSSVLYEAMVVGGIGVPLGILCGILGIWITLLCIGSKFSGMLYGGFASNEVVLSLHISWQAVVIALVIGMITVLISAWIPARRATRISAVEAIRSAQDVKISRKEVRVSRLNYKLFGLEGLLAKKYFKRDRKKYRATVVSLFMSIVLFISASAYIMYFTGAAGAVMDVKSYDLRYTSIHENEETNRQLFEQLSAVKGVNNAERSSVFSGLLTHTSPEAYTEFYRQNAGTEENGETYPPTVNVVFLDDDHYRQFLTDQGIDPSPYMDSENPKAVLYDQLTVFMDEKILTTSVFAQDPEQGVFQILDEELLSEYNQSHSDGNIPEEVYRNIPVSIGSRVQSLPMGGDDYAGYQSALVYPRSALNSVFAEVETQKLSYVEYMYFQAENHRQVYQAMSLILQQEDMGSYRLYDQAESQEVQNNTILIINVLSYGFIALISLIAVANVFNTISTNVGLRRREFAMLRSVGLTQKGFNRMMCYECLMYGTKSLAWGLPVSFLVVLWIFNVIRSGWESVLLLPWHAVIIAILSVFVVVFATMMYAMRRIRRENLIDALKTEIQ